MIVVIAVAAVLLPILFGLGLAAATARFDNVVAVTKDEVENKDKGFNPSLTMGFRIKTTESPEDQVKQARLLAAKKAAATPRGANMRIGRKGESDLKTAWQGAKEDPMTAAKIAAIHGWQAVQTGAVVKEGAPVAAAGAAVAGKPGKIKLVAGKDYPVIEITDGMDPAEKRKARIANAKAKSAAYKAAKAAGVPAAAAPVAGATAQAAAPAQTAVTTTIDIEPPKLIEITDDMPPDEVRKARIANSKAKSAYNKALKAAGIDPSTVQDGQVVQAAAPAPAQPAAQPAQQQAAPAADSAALASIPEPDYIEITDDMEPDDVRKARISNAKARSAYNKALKAAGIDPKSVK